MNPEALWVASSDVAEPEPGLPVPPKEARFTEWIRVSLTYNLITPSLPYRREFAAKLPLSPVSALLTIPLKACVLLYTPITFVDDV